MRTLALCFALGTLALGATAPARPAPRPLAPGDYNERMAHANPATPSTAHGGYVAWTPTINFQGAFQGTGLSGAMDSNGVAHAAWISSGDIYYANSGWKTRSVTGWSSPVQLMDTPLGAWDTDTFVNSADGTVYVAWTQVINQDMGQDRRIDVFYRSRNPVTGDWGAPILVLAGFSSLPGNWTQYVSPRGWVDNVGTIHFAVRWTNFTLAGASQTDIRHKVVGGAENTVETVFGPDSLQGPGRLAQVSGAVAVPWYSTVSGARLGIYTASWNVIDPDGTNTAVVVPVAPFSSTSFAVAFANTAGQTVTAVYDITGATVEGITVVIIDPDLMPEPLPMTGVPSSIGVDSRQQIHLDGTVIRHRRGDGTERWGRNGDLDFTGGFILMDPYDRAWRLSTIGAMRHWDPNTGSQGGGSMMGFGPMASANVVNGNLMLDFPFFSDSGGGIATSFGVTYNSKLHEVQTMPAGWTASYSHMLTIDPGQSNAGWVTFPDGTRVVFKNTGPTTWETDSRFDFLATIEKDQPVADRYQMRTPRGFKWVFFKSTGKLEKMIDPNGNELLVTYLPGDPQVPSMITDSVGRTTTLIYDPNNRLEKVIHLGGADMREFKLVYGGDGQVSQVILDSDAGAGGLQRTYSMTWHGSTDWAAYKAKKYLDELRTPRGIAGDYGWKYTWYQDFTVRNVTDPAELSITDDGSYSANPTSQTLTRTLNYIHPAQRWNQPEADEETHFADRKAKTTKYRHSFIRNLITRTENALASPHVTQWTYHETDQGGGSFHYSWRKVKTMVTPTNVTWEYVIGSPTTYPGSVTQVKIPTAFVGGTPATRTYTYTTDGFFQVKTDTDQLGAVTTYSYDSRGNLTNTAYPTVTLPNGEEQQTNETVTYVDATAKGLVSTVTSPGGRTTTYEYADASTGLSTGTLISGNSKSEKREYYANGQLKKHTMPEGNITEFEYTRLYQLFKRKETSVSGSPFTEMQYDVDGNHLKTIDPLGKTTESVYDKLGRVKQTIDAVLKTTTYEFDREGLTRRVLRPVGGKSEMLFDAVSRTTNSRVDATPPGGATTWREVINTYDEATGPMGDPAYKGFLTTSRMVGSTNLDTKYVYDPRGNRKETQLADAQSTTMHTCYDLLDRPVQSFSKFTGTTQRASYSSIDVVGRVPLSASINDLGSVTCGGTPSQSNALTSTTLHESDDLPTKVHDTQKRSVNQTYTQQGWSDELKDHNQRTVSKTIRNNDGFVTEVRTIDYRSGELVAVATYVPNGRNQVASSCDAFGHSTVNTYVANGWLDEVSSPLGRKVKFEYYDDGLVKKKRLDPTGLNITVEYFYDDDRRLTKTRVWNPASLSYSADYDIEYTKDGQMSKFTYPDASFETWTYDDHGRMATHVDLNSVTTTMTYDTLNRPLTETRVKSPLTVSSITWTYHDSGEVKSVEQTAGMPVKIEYVKPDESSGYDNHGRLTDYRISLNGGQWQTVNYVYDSSSNITQATTDGQTLNYTYNNLNQLIRIVHNGQEMATFQYDKGGRLKAQVLRGSIRTIHDYDRAGRLTRQKSTTTGGMVVSDLERVYDIDGLVTQEILHHLGVTWTHGYDNAMRLTNSALNGNGTGQPPPFTNVLYDEPALPVLSASSNTAGAAAAAMTVIPPYTGQWIYDPAGNITQFTENSQTTTRTHNNRSQLTQENLPGGDKYVYKYDLQGNQTKEYFWPAGWVGDLINEETRYKEIVTREYGAFNEITNYTLDTRAADNGPLTNATSYKYYRTAGQVRLGKENMLGASEQQEWFVHMGDNILTEYKRTAGPSNPYIPKAVNVPGAGTDNHLVRIDLLVGNSKSLYLNTAIGSTHRVVDEAGVVLNQDVTTPWGKIVPGYSWTDAVPNRYGLTGQEKDKETATLSDPTGEMHYRARAYSPRQMRFVQNDPPLFTRAHAHYAYTGNNPVSRRDSRGTYWTLNIEETEGWHFSVFRAAIAWLGAGFSKKTGKLRGWIRDVDPGPAPQDEKDLFTKWSDDDEPHDLGAFIEGLLKKHGNKIWDTVWAHRSEFEAWDAGFRGYVAPRVAPAIEVGSGLIMGATGGPVGIAAGAYLVMDGASAWAAAADPSKDVVGKAYADTFGPTGGKYVRTAAAVLAGLSPLAVKTPPAPSVAAAKAEEAASQLIGVTANEATTLNQTLRGIKVGDQSAIKAVEAFGSRAGSVFRGRGPTATSDLDIFVTIDSAVVNAPDKMRSVLSALERVATEWSGKKGFPLSIVSEIDSIAPSVKAAFSDKGIKFLPLN